MASVCSLSDSAEKLVDVADVVDEEYRLYSCRHRTEWTVSRLADIAALTIIILLKCA